MASDALKQLLEEVIKEGNQEPTNRKLLKGAFVKAKYLKLRAVESATTPEVILYSTIFLLTSGGNIFGTSFG